MFRPPSARAVAASLFLFCLSIAVHVAPAQTKAPSSAAKSTKSKRKASTRKTLAAQIQALLDQPQLARAHWGIEAVELASGRILVSQNADQLFLPASNAKLFTMAAALSLAGPDYRFRTTVESAVKPDPEGHLVGDLIIVGRGDPNISGRVIPYEIKTERVPPHTQILEELADQVASKGVKSVSGDFIADDTFYSAERFGTGWAQDDLQWIDGAPVSALSFNDNVVFVNIQPGALPGDKAVVTLEPETTYYELDNRIVTGEQGSKRKIGIHREPGSKQMVLWGSLPVGDKGMREPMAVEDPAEFVAQLFRTMLERRGVTIAGKTRVRHGEIAQFFDLLPATPTTSESAAPAPSPTPTATPPPDQAAGQPTVLAEHVSLPFIEDVRVTNKTSQNLHAELALRLAGKLAGTGASFEGGEAAVKKFLVQAGLQEDEFVLLDGSGLSRRDLVTPSAVTRLLIYAAKQPWGTLYEGSLPIAGVDGSLQERFLNTPAAGLIHAKTGTLSHVNSLSGYGQTLAGRRFVFSIFCNNHTLGSAKILPVIDAIVNLLVTEGETVKK